MCNNCVNGRCILTEKECPYNYFKQDSLLLHDDYLEQTECPDYE